MGRRRRLGSQAEEIGPQVRTFRGAPRLGARHTQEATADPLGIGARGVTLETDDGNVGRAADRRDDELTEAITEQAGPFAKAIIDVGARLHLHLATHAVRRAHDPDNGVVSQSRG